MNLTDIIFWFAILFFGISLGLAGVVLLYNFIDGIVYLTIMYSELTVLSMFILGLMVSCVL